jgi:hypothetical protein
MKVAANEIRHLDGIKGTFYISDTEYIAPATFHQKGKPASQMIYSNVREIVEHCNTHLTPSGIKQFLLSSR